MMKYTVILVLILASDLSLTRHESETDQCKKMASHFNDSFTTSSTIRQAVLDEIMQIALNLSRQDLSTESLCKAAYTKIRLIMRNEETSNSSIDKVGPGFNKVESDTFFVSLRLLIHKTNSLKRSQCLKDDKEYDAKYRKCIASYDNVTVVKSNRGIVILQTVENTLSIICLCVLLITYYLFPELRTIPGQQIMCLSAFLIVGHALQVAGIHTETMGEPCNFIGILTHYIYLVIFCFMDFVAFSIYMTFCSSEQAHYSDRTRRNHLSLVTSIVSPFLIVIPCVIVNYVDRTNTIYGNVGGCFVTNIWANLFSFVIPICASLIFNLVCISAVMVTIYRANKSNDRVLKDRNKTKHKKFHILILSLKLATLTGIGWMFGFVGTLTQISLLKWIFIILCPLQGFTVFVGFSCNKRTIELYKRKFLRVGEERDTLSTI